MKLHIFFAYLLFASVAFAQETPVGPLWVRTTGKLPFLEYGPGDDRLGGAKMGYLDSNILLKVVDSLKDDYVVQLSRQHRAFIPKLNVRRVEGIRARTHVLSNSWMVNGDDRYDYVSISLEEKLPYRSQMQIHPARIVVDIFGATSNTNWVTQLRSAKGIRNAWYEQVEDDVLRVYIELSQDRHWGYQISYPTASSRLVIRVKREPAALDLRYLRIAIDAGHGGNNSGAAGIRTRILEKDYTLLMAKELQQQLRRKGNRQVIMTRSTDTTLDMAERILLLREADPDLLISIHLNSSARDSVKGTSTYYRHIGFRSLSQSVLKRMLELKLKEYGNVGHFNFALSGPTEYPNCLVEVAFLSNPEDEQRIIDPAFHRQIAQQMIKGIKDWIRETR